ncbi:GNAT family N-acetyltransferase [Motiliproteus coralliicola]|uniref:GNAT family N-acetyltransferase n=1 Tax=Motiliproteus coralliicola TaxID=2283196 RepID=A0A369WV81_9GAMM|nr:GNAT family N-acetyltransferase [Motiliproteus coralliicola]RDE25033.1 GNAT family N-acetyltransferase [Motiliproteus coralliicola]
MTKLLIEDVTAADLDQLTDYFVIEQGVHRAAHPELFTAVDSAAFKDFLLQSLDSSTSYLRIAKRQTEIAGFLFVEIYQHHGSIIRLPRKFACVELIYVDPGYRRQGVGSALLNDAKQIARLEGVDRVELDVMAFNGGARDFYANQGFSDLSCRMDTKV